MTTLGKTVVLTAAYRVSRSQSLSYLPKAIEAVVAYCVCMLQKISNTAFSLASEPSCRAGNLHSPAIKDQAEINRYLNNSNRLLQGSFLSHSVGTRIEDEPPNETVGLSTAFEKSRNPKHDRELTQRIDRATWPWRRDFELA
jgi:hypothetical protein